MVEGQSEGIGKLSEAFYYVKDKDGVRYGVSVLY